MTLTREIQLPNMESVAETEEGFYLPKPGTEETQTARWLNRISTALRSWKVAKAGQQATSSAQELEEGRRKWSAEFAAKPMPTELDMKMKPDVTLLQPDPFDPHGPDSWRNVVSFLELSSLPFSRVVGQLARKAYAVFVAQPGRRFLPILSITRSTEFRLHIFDRAGLIHSRNYCIHRNADYLVAVLYTLVFGSPKLVGYDPTIFFSPAFERSIQTRAPPTIQIGDTTHMIVRCLFSGEVINGRATLCFVVTDAVESDKNNPRQVKLLPNADPLKEYVVKCSWTRLGRMMKEEQMLLRIKQSGLRHGVPVLVKAWTVQIDGIDDSTVLRRPDYLLRHLTEDKLPEVRVQRRLLLEHVGTPLEDFTCIQELLSVLVDIVDGAFVLLSLRSRNY